MFEGDTEIPHNIRDSLRAIKEDVELGFPDHLFKVLEYVIESPTTSFRNNERRVKVQMILTEHGYTSSRLTIQKVKDFYKNMPVSGY